MVTEAIIVAAITTIGTVTAAWLLSRRSKRESED